MSVTDSMTFSSLSLSHSARDELRGPGTRERPAAQRGAVAVLLHDVEVALVVHVGEAEAARRDGDVLEPVEEVAVLRAAALEREVSERRAAGCRPSPSVPTSREPRVSPESKRYWFRPPPMGLRWALLRPTGPSRLSASGPKGLGARTDGNVVVRRDAGRSCTDAESHERLEGEGAPCDDEPARC